MIISNFLFLKFFLNLSKLLLFAVSQFKNVILFDLYLNLKFLSRPYICALLKYLAKTVALFSKNYAAKLFPGFSLIVLAK